MNMLPYIPVNYILNEFNSFSIWHSPEEQLNNINFISEIISESLFKLKKKYNIFLTRKLFFCIFLSNQEAREQLQRNISSTMLMIPFTSKNESLIICHSPEIHPLNADRKRMMRHLTHEIIHAFNYEVTDSTNILGENMRNIKISSWLDEGIAEGITALTINDISILNKYESIVNSSDETISDIHLEKYINDLNSDKRELAFAVSVMKANKLLQKNNIRTVLINNYKNNILN